MKKIIFFLFALLLSVNLQAQNVTVTGTVTEASDNEPVIGAYVKVKGTTKGAVTDMDGHYSISVDNNAVLEFTMVGFRTEDVRVGNKSVIDVVLKDDVSDLNEIVVIGYGQVKKSDLTSSISTIKGDKLDKLTTGNVMDALQGQVNGVQVTNSGSPGSAPRVIIRGATTVNGSDPLYVVDGMPVGTNINFLDQNDIASMEVLKDASAEAIYGTRGSNGVILITTKKGEKGKVKFTASASMGLQTMSKPSIAGASEYEQVFDTRYTNDGNTSTYKGIQNITDAQGTNWWKECMRDVSLMHSYNFGFSGGNDKLLYSANIGYFRQNSQYKTGYWQKINARFSMEYNFNKIVKAGIDLNPRYENWSDTPDLIGAIMGMDPTTPIMRDKSEWTDNQYSNYARSNNNETWNPVASMYRLDSHTDEYEFLTTPYVSITPVKGLTFRTQFGVNAKFQMADSFTPQFYIDNLEQASKSTANRKFTQDVDWNWTNTLTYMHTFAKKHNLNVMGGYTVEKFQDYFLKGSSDNTPSNDEALRYVSAGTTNMQVSGTNAYSSLISYLGRVMYNYDERYYLTASVRVDGSSKFPVGNKYATFPALSGAWRVTGEPFMKNQHIFDNLKFRIGWGKVGNQNIDNSAYLSAISTTRYVFGNTSATTVGSTIGSIGNANVKWETVEDYDLGVDMSFLNSRLNVTADWFTKKSHDMLMQKENLLVLGYPMWNGQMWENVGSMRSTGWELSLNWNDKISDFTYGAGLNFSHVATKALKLNGDYIYTGSSNGDYIIRNEAGQPISQFYGYVVDGIFQNETEVESYTNEQGTRMQPNAQPGDFRYKDVNHDGVIDENDKTYIGNPIPKLTMGLSLNAAYKHFDFQAQFYGTFGNDIYNLGKERYFGTDGSNVIAGTLEKAWHGEGTSYDVPRLSVADNNGNHSKPSTFFVENGSYFRCKLLQIGYTLPLQLCSVRFSFSAENPFTITGYSGMDPEAAAMGGVTQQGIDWTGYPNPHTFLFGVNFTF
jgi:TonB-linked SusC/RagA family outer membrane protein